MKRIEIIGVTEVPSDLGEEGITTIEITVFDRVTKETDKFTTEMVGHTFNRDMTTEDLIEYMNRRLRLNLTVDDIVPDPRQHTFDVAWMPLRKPQE